MSNEHDDSEDVMFTIEVNGEELTVDELGDRIRAGMYAPEELPLTLPGRSIALAWLAVSLAPSNDSERPALYRRINIAVHPSGVALAATDSYWMCRAFVPFDGDHEHHEVPSLDEVPAWSFTIADVELRIRDLMRYVERITRPKKGEDDTYRSPVAVVFTRTTDFNPDIPTLDPTLSQPQVVVEIPGEERIISRESEIEYPNLAQLARFQPKSAEHLLFSPDLMTKAASAVARIGGGAIRIKPNTSGSVSFHAEGTVRSLHGILMPLADDSEEAEA